MLEKRNEFSAILDSKQKHTDFYRELTTGEEVVIQTGSHQRLSALSLELSEALVVSS